MKSLKLISAVLLLTISQIAFGQKPVESLDKWKYLIGEWVGEDIGEPGQNKGSFTFQTDLDGKIIIRKNHSFSPATKDSPSSVHNDILIIYSDNSGIDQKAIYFDNEGHVINYQVIFKGNTLVLTSNATANNPRFRLSYIPIDNNTVNVTFEMSSSQNPEEFKMYLSGKVRKIK